MSLINFFTLGYDESYLIIGIIFGVIISLYGYFRLNKLFEDYGFKNKKTMFSSAIVSILIFCLMLNVWAMPAILIFYICLSSVIADIIYLIYKVILKNREDLFSKFYKKGFLLVVIFIIFMCVGVYGMNHIVETDYDYTNADLNNSYTVVFLSDIHYDTIQNPELLNESIGRINARNPDIVILGGDIVDERTTNKSMNEVFKVLGRINSTYGIFYVYGNHDRQPYTLDYENGSRTFTDEDLVTAITSNGIKILCDEDVLINNEIILIGRADEGFDSSDYKTRANASELFKDIDKDKFIIVADHQPIDQENISKEGGDLEISGHTHAGQIFPFDVVQKIFGMSDYGVTHFGNLTQIVSSGFTGWGWPIRNVGYSEYVVINID